LTVAQISVDRVSELIYVYINMRKYSTPEVAKMLGIHQPNLQRAIREERISAPPLVKVGRLRIRLWSKREVEAARKELKKVKK
jgi:predicted DNA-binding transcriptional regulator AlpA